MSEFVSFFKQDWVSVGTTLTAVYLLFYVFIKGLRDILDKTPQTDDNPFERFVTVLGKLADLLGKGKRP